MPRPATLVIAIFGPTASGKSAVAEALTDAIPAEIVSADSMQVYRGVEILTNQPERPTRLVGIWDLAHEASVGEYQRLAHRAIDEILGWDLTPIVAGGTGLYLRAALGKLDLPPPPGPGVRELWQRVYDRLGPVQAHELLRGHDPGAAAAVHPNDRRRVVRALELVAQGRSLRPQRDRLWTAATRHPTLVVGLEVPREKLVARIEERAARMFEQGVEEEVQLIRDQPLSKTARQIIGLNEVAHLPRKEAIEALVVRTRRYAAYQRKWMRRIPGLVSVSADRRPEEVAAEILALARARQRVPAG
jgi:tRNA dimethylallyltransferase